MADESESTSSSDSEMESQSDIDSDPILVDLTPSTDTFDPGEWIEIEESELIDSLSRSHSIMRVHTKYVVHFLSLFCCRSVPGARSAYNQIERGR